MRHNSHYDCVCMHVWVTQIHNATKQCGELLYVGVYVKRWFWGVSFHLLSFILEAPSI